VQRVHRVNTLLSVEEAQRRDSARCVQETYLSPKPKREVQSVCKGSSISKRKSQEGSARCAPESKSFKKKKILRKRNLFVSR
jgi:hypothetical protein